MNLGAASTSKLATCSQGPKAKPDGTTSLGHQRQQVRRPAGLPTAFALAAFVSETVGCCCLASALWAHSSSAIWHHQPQPMLFGPAAARSKHRLKQGCRIRFASCIQTSAGLRGGSQGGMARPHPSAASGMLRTSPHCWYILTKHTKQYVGIESHCHAWCTADRNKQGENARHVSAIVVIKTSPCMPPLLQQLLSFLHHNAHKLLAAGV